MGLPDAQDGRAHPGRACGTSVHRERPEQPGPTGEGSCLGHRRRLAGTGYEAVSGGPFENAGEAVGRLLGTGAGGVIGLDAGLIAGGVSGGIAGLPTGPGEVIAIPAGAVAGGAIGAGIGAKYGGDFGGGAGKGFGQYLDRKYEDWTHANKKAEKLKETRKNCDHCLKSETPDDIAAEGQPDPEKPILKDGGQQLIKPAGSDGLSEAQKDFDRLGADPETIQNRANGVTTGTLPDGRTAIVRPLSEPTLEIKNNGTPDFKIRYR